MSYEEIFQDMARPLGELFEEARQRLAEAQPDSDTEDYNDIINLLFE